MHTTTARDFATEFITARRTVIADAARQAGVVLDETTLAAQARTTYAHLSDRALVQRYDAEARERWTDQDDALLSSERMDDMHAELVARDLDWDDPRYSA